ncbi:MAG: prepilin peptidase [Desulfobacterales bacterium]|nr:prepilin peptidase [Desulfobacterales bacterium]
MDIYVEHIEQLLLFLIFMLGASAGSFYNVCIYRIPKKESIVTPGSSCPFCKKKIPFYLNIPVLSYFILQGKCKYCKHPFSLRYPIVEALTGVILVALYLKFGYSITTIFWFVFISILIIISFIDIDYQIIPDIFSLPGIIIFATAPLFVPDISVIDSILGILLGGGSLYFISITYYIIKKTEGMGGGDIKLLAMIGAAIGWKGVIVTVFIGSLTGTIAGIIIMISSRIIDIKLKIPFGPYLSIGAVIYIFFGQALIKWYLTNTII